MAELSETSVKKMQQITCENDNCAHYIRGCRLILRIQYL